MKTIVRYFSLCLTGVIALLSSPGSYAYAQTTLSCVSDEFFSTTDKNAFESVEFFVKIDGINTYVDLSTCNSNSSVVDKRISEEKIEFTCAVQMEATMSIWYLTISRLTGTFDLLKEYLDISKGGQDYLRGYKGACEPAKQRF